MLLHDEFDLVIHGALDAPLCPQLLQLQALLLRHWTAIPCMLLDLAGCVGACECLCMRLMSIICLHACVHVSMLSEHMCKKLRVTMQSSLHCHNMRLCKHET